MELYKFFSLDPHFNPISSTDTVGELIEQVKDYKYRDLKHINDLLGDKKLYMAEPKDFNDPLECCATFDKEIYETDEHKKFEKEKHKHLPYSQQLRARIEAKNMRGKVSSENAIFPLTRRDASEHAIHGVSCFCGSFRAVPMWAYYASKHTGLCVRFTVNLPDPVLEQLASNERLHIEEELKQGEDSYWPILTKVQYKEELVKAGKSDVSEPGRVFLQAVSTKSASWQHEEEYRLIVPGMSGYVELSRLYNGQKENKPLLEIKEIIFGIGMANNAKKFIKRSYKRENIIFSEADVNFNKLEIKRKK